MGQAPIYLGQATRSFNTVPWSVQGRVEVSLVSTINLEWNNTHV